MVDRICQWSPDRSHRYTLWREWDMFRPGKFVQFIGLNPSTADETQDDPTIRRCIDFATRWGYGVMCMTNLFAFRATQPEDMKEAADPLGPENMQWLKIVAREADLIVAAWGNHGSFNRQSRTLLKVLMDMDLKIHCLRVTQSGQPEHPLYVPADTVLKGFNFTT